MICFWFYSHQGPLCLTFKPCELNPCINAICLQLGELGKYECMCKDFKYKYPNCSAQKSPTQSTKTSTIQSYTTKSITKSASNITIESKEKSSMLNLEQNYRSLINLILISIFNCLIFVALFYSLKFVNFKILLLLNKKILRK